MSAATPPPGPGPLHVYEYAVIRVVPRVERAEFLNAGVVLWCRPVEFLGALTADPSDRLRVLAPDADLDAVTRHVAAWEGVCAGTAGSGAGEAAGARFRWLTAPRSTVVQTSPVHCGRTADPAGELRRLFTRLVVGR
ncbi:DUF3037 domain-containing protein [Kineococcus gynurae]|uniref:DUF3037 domain-containing protein n=1 Tax=Kineococcus gynurae TaxID=452979 RepID=A0ABV5LWL0_9ACTN